MDTSTTLVEWRRWQRRPASEYTCRLARQTAFRPLRTCALEGGEELEIGPFSRACAGGSRTLAGARRLPRRGRAADRRRALCRERRPHRSRGLRSRGARSHAAHARRDAAARDARLPRPRPDDHDRRASARRTRSSRRCDERAASSARAARSTGCRRASRCASTSSTTAIETFERAGFRQIVTPVFEDTALFARTAGETSDVVSKEMYSFHDRSDRSLTLRPEGTAPVVRAYLEHGLSREPQPVRLWYVAPMYRYAAPQAGRYREHCQFGVEAIGSDDPGGRRRGHRAAGAPGTARSGSATSSCTSTRSATRPAGPAYREALVAYFEPLRDQLSAESQERLEKNPMRILDSKDERDQPLIPDAPRITAVPVRRVPRALRDGARPPRRRAGSTHVRRRHARARPRLLHPHGLGVDPGRRRAARRRRSRAVAATTASPSRSAGKRTPGVGFGCGIERLVLALEKQGRAPERARLRLVLRRRRRRTRARASARCSTRRAPDGLAAEMDLAGRSLKGQLRHAQRLGARVVSVIGPDEWERRAVARSRDDEVPLDDGSSLAGRSSCS